MKINTEVILDKNDIECLRKTAQILTAISSESRCFTARDIYDVASGKYEPFGYEPTIIIKED